MFNYDNYFCMFIEDKYGLKYAYLYINYVYINYIYVFNYVCVCVCDISRLRKLNCYLQQIYIIFILEKLNVMHCR